jgi:hypothetical protein
MAATFAVSKTDPLLPEIACGASRIPLETERFASCAAVMGSVYAPNAQS